MDSEKPGVFVIGDSISLQYGPHLERMLAGRFDYGRKSGQEQALKDLDIPAGANGGDSERVLAYVRALQSDGMWQPELLLLNCGLHDLKTDPATGEKQVPLERYRSNLRAILDLLAGGGVPVVWVRTTPVDDRTHSAAEKSFHRFAADVDAYNRAADEIMSSAGVAVADLHSLTASLGGPSEIFRDHVHFPAWVQRLQAAYLVGVVEMWFAAVG
ncbi:MAG: SGNH/GDSL hydrolase family protein [Planctomycetota bacterium]